jgi:outer membrane protein assembly factor BamB
MNGRSRFVVMKSRRSVLALLGMLAGTLPLAAGNWPEWRGEGGNGVLKDGGFPLTWAPDKHVLWKAPLPAPGNSSPVVHGNHVFVSCANAKGDERMLLAFDRTTGELLWKRSVPFSEDDPTHPTNPWCAASPATDGTSVFVWNGSAGATAYDFEGNERWHRDLGKFVHQWGHASSPRLYKDTVILFGGPGPRVVLAALDKLSGKSVWEKEFNEVASPPEELHGSFVTPFLWVNGPRAELLIPLPGYIASFDPDNGEELWRCEGLGSLTYTDAMVGENAILAFSGYRGPSIGLRKPSPDETGNLTTTHLLWKNEAILQRVGSGVIVGDRFYLCGRNGELQCGDVGNGEILWTHPLREQAWSAISLADRKLYLTDQAARTLIFEPADTFKLIHENLMNPGERSNSTLAFSDGQLFLRTYDYLYAIAAPTDAAED